jgi:predicted nucleotidyltransferase
MTVDTPRSELPSKEIAALCERWRVVELSIFGSAMRGDFGSQSDVDLLVEFDSGVSWSLIEIDRMAGELAEIFGRKVDLVERTAIESSANYIRRRHILQSAEPVYVAR